jgi:hypothetical protein
MFVNGNVCVCVCRYGRTGFPTMMQRRACCAHANLRSYAVVIIAVLVVGCSVPTAAHNTQYLRIWVRSTQLLSLLIIVLQPQQNRHVCARHVLALSNALRIMRQRRSCARQRSCRHRILLISRVHNSTICGAGHHHRRTRRRQV